MVCDSSQSAEKEMYWKTLDRNIREGFKYKVKYRLKNLSVKWMSSTVHWQLHARHWTPEGVSDHLLLLLDLWPPYGSMPWEADAIGPLSRLILLYPSTCVYPGKGTHKKLAVGRMRLNIYSLQSGPTGWSRIDWILPPKATDPVR